MYVAGYCRVSTEREDQTNSFAAQQRFFREYVEQRSGWELYRIYADEGLSGTDTRNRAEFNRMIADAHAGRFQLIVTKEISRFSRNILDTLAYTRELKSLGIGVLFFTENINTLSPDAEMLLTFMGTIAQEESRRTSVRVKWGQLRQMERGVVFGPSLLGYRVEHGNIALVPEEAELVKLIFQKYGHEKKGTSMIARELREAGYLTPTGKTEWNPGSILKILKNEKYAGDLIQKKTITPNYLTHRKKQNCGEEPFVIIRDHHQPIVSRELWSTVQEEIRKRNRANNRQSVSRSCMFSGKIICGECGSIFAARYKYGKNGCRTRRWSCSNASRYGKTACGISKLLREDDAIYMMKCAVKSIIADQIMDEILQNTAATPVKGEGREAAANDLALQIRQHVRKKATALDAFLSGRIEENEWYAVKELYDAKIEQAKMKLNQIQNAQMKDPGKKTEMIESLVTGKRMSEVICRKILRRITVYKDRHMELQLEELPHIFVFSENTENGIKIE